MFNKHDAEASGPGKSLNEIENAKRRPHLKLGFFEGVLQSGRLELRRESLLSTILHDCVRLTQQVYSGLRRRGDDCQIQ